MKLSDQAMGSLMMVLQKCLMEQSDIIPMLKDLNLTINGDEINVENPPTLHIDQDKLNKDGTGNNA